MQGKALIFITSQTSATSEWVICYLQYVDVIFQDLEKLSKLLISAYLWPCIFRCRGLDLRVIKHEAEYYGITPLGMYTVSSYKLSFFKNKKTIVKSYEKITLGNTLWLYETFWKG